MTKVNLYKVNGEKSGQVDLPKEYVQKDNIGLLTQAIRVYEDRSHRGTSMAKTRSMVNATGAKMYKQKGTGNARHGDRKAPIFAGGGVAHGPKGVKRIMELPKKLARRALLVALSMKAREGKVVIAEKIDSIAKTKDAQKFLDGVRTEMKGNVKETLLALTGKNKDVARNFRNIYGVSVKSYNDLNAYNVFFSNLIVLDKEALDNADKKEVKKTAEKEVKEAEAAKPVRKETTKKAAAKPAVKKAAVKAKKGTEK